MKSALFSLILLITFFLPVKSQENTLVEALKKHVTILASDSLDGRAFGFPDKTLAVDYIVNQFASAGFSAPDGNYIKSFYQRDGLYLAVGMNIIGIIPGNDPVLKDEYILIGAHYDHLGWKTVDNKKVVYNGADDNASGVASIIEAGRMLMAKKMSLKRSIIIAAFDGEEAGLLGSYAFVARKVVDPSKIKFMLSLDMVGMLSKNNGVDFAGLNSMREGEDFIRKMAQLSSLQIKATKNAIESRTDTWPFAGVGIPAVHVTTGEVSPYHKPEDDSNLLDYEGLGKITGFITEMVSGLANRESIEANHRFISHSVNPGFSLGLSLGAGNTHFYYHDNFYEGKPVLAFEAGINSQARISRRFRLQPAVKWELYGSHTEGGTLRMQSIDPQLDLLWVLNSSSSSFASVFIFGGVYYRFNFAATEDWKSIDLESKYLNQEPGIEFGAGTQFMKKQMSLSYKYGLKNINASATGGDILSRGLVFSWTWFF